MWGLSLLRRRYFFNQNNRLRMRYQLLGLGSFFCAGLAMFSGRYDGQTARYDVPQKAEAYTVSHADISPAAGEANNSANQAQQSNQPSAMMHLHKAALALAKPPEPKEIDLSVKSGDTLAGLLQEAGLTSSDAYYSVKALSAHFDPRKVKVGQEIRVHKSPDESGAMVYDQLVFNIDPVRYVSVKRGADGEFTASLTEKEVAFDNHAKKAEIETSLYGSAARAGIPPQVIAELIRVYSWSVDFQRDIRRGDKIEVLYSTKTTDDGDFVGYGDISYASLTVGGRVMPIYRYEQKDGSVDYFDPKGLSVRKTLMKTPVDGARLSSGFGMRKHPVLGYSKMHKGTDFAAPTGTPIYAAGDGTIEYAGRKGSYGNYVRLRHNSTLKTAYAHMHNIAKGMGTGKRVKQGDVIGYIGATGRVTGPHLHYEVLVNNVQVNPNRVDLPVGEQLKNAELERFKALKGATDQEYASLVGDLKVATREVEDSSSAAN